MNDLELYFICCDDNGENFDLLVSATSARQAVRLWRNWMDRSTCGVDFMNPQHVHNLGTPHIAAAIYPWPYYSDQKEEY